MKKILMYAAIICSIFIACNNNKQEGNSSENDDSGEKEKKISKRDLSVTKENAYNNIFLDSTNVETFISEKQLADSLSRRIRSFYNARNYQFACFHYFME